MKLMLSGLHLCSFLLVSLLFMSQAAPCRAQGGARAAEDEEPLAAALRLARGLEPGLDKSNTLIRIVQVHQDAGRLEEAVRAAGAIDEEGPRALMLSRLANRFAEAGKLERAAELLSESLSTIRRAEDDQGATPQLLREIVGGEMLFTFEEFASRNEPRKGALARLFEAGRAESAAKILSEVRATALDPDRDDLVAARVLADAARLSASSDASKAAEFLSESLTVARRVEAESERLTALCEVARAHADLGDKKTAEALLDEGFESAQTLDEFEKDDGLRRLAHAYAALGLTDKALKALRETGDAGFESATAALGIAVQTNRPEAFKESLKRVVEALGSFDGEYGKKLALLRLIREHGGRSPELLAEVLGAARALEEEQYRAELLVAVGDRYTESNRKEAALDVWEQALQAARAVELTREDLNAGDVRMNDGEKVRLLSALALRFVRAGVYVRAPEIAQDIRAVHARAHALAEGYPEIVRGTEATLARLADELTRAGQKEAALAVLAAAGDPDEKLGENVYARPRAEAFATLGAAYARAGDKGRAAAYFRRALQFSDVDEDFDGNQKLSALIAVGARYAEAGMAPDARARKNLRRLVRGVEADKE